MRNIFEYFKQDDYLSHFGILGMKWGVRRFQNKDGSLTKEGQERYRSASQVAEEVKNRIAPDLIKLEAIDDASDRFNNIGDELAEDYDNYYKSLKNNRSFKNDLLESMADDFGVGCDDEDLFDMVKEERIDDLLRQYEPKNISDKVKSFYEAGDEYFNQLKMFSDPIIKSYKDQGVDAVTKKYAGTTEKIDTYVKDLLSSNVQWNSYMYRHFDDYWVADVDSRYELIDSITMDDYNNWAKNIFSKGNSKWRYRIPLYRNITAHFETP